ncbi:MAG: hypothetical protein JJE55_14290 [Flavobacteriaceae bacterium]|nr:hypothetical protein [Flavobacteriaceae bacterium]
MIFLDKRKEMKEKRTFQFPFWAVGGTIKTKPTQKMNSLDGKKIAMKKKNYRF